MFHLWADVPTCASERDGTCLTRQQKAVVRSIFAGARNSHGQPLYSSFAFDPGLVQPDWAAWEFDLSVMLDPAAVGFVFSTPPESPAHPRGPARATR